MKIDHLRWKIKLQGQNDSFIPVAELQIKRIRYAHRKLGYIIENHKIFSGLNSITKGKTSAFIRKHLADFSHTDETALESFFLKVFYLFIQSREDRFYNLLILCRFCNAGKSLTDGQN